MAKATNNTAPQVGIIMGSDSDLPVMEAAAEMLRHFGIPYELTVVSAHRTPMRMVEYAKAARDRGLKVIIAGAGGAAHLPGMVASLTPLPVIGVPVKSSNSIDGWDSILSILQMPNGIPVATVALNAAKNAGILAGSMIGAFDAGIGDKVAAYKAGLEEEVLKKASKLQDAGHPNQFDS
ncbi:5-(carboxyamino)imidazole ribonucleotide mutase [Flavihumibacter petaseus]|uniref:N5-carboxyaminoimidazole ribonucleotide mutase n=1 Tax=Flavihumibacter petaseus NBRC 106054 TaxID=1220578 RepID=A0A0E9N3R2_9BACT|nr:5-(carboxyamino)imidazole ribonucleotide mutase [Flavihumibacter petaseus]GAO44454.1 N5-carboxyaminoimidazole ribonucleotide mutase [Flavihumibacter petaseus NBRC 106054]